MTTPDVHETHALHEVHAAILTPDNEEIYRGPIALAYQTVKKGRPVWYVAYDGMTCQYLPTDYRIEPYHAV